MDKQKKKHLNFMFIYQHKITNVNTVDFGVLDDSFNFEMITVNKFNHELTNGTYEKLYSIFNRFIITHTTSIGFIDTISKNSFIYKYLKIISQQIGFNLKIVHLDEIPRRICNYHKSYVFTAFNKFGKNRNAYISEKQIDSRFINKLFTKLSKTEKCPWISEEIENNISRLSRLKKQREIRVRLGCYYLLVKKFLYSRVKMSISGKNKNYNE